MDVFSNLQSLLNLILELRVTHYLKSAIKTYILAPIWGGCSGTRSPLANTLGHVSQIPEDTFSPKKKENDNCDQNW